MALEFKQHVVKFDPTKGRKQTEPGSVTFDSNVRRSNIAIKGFHIGYTDKDRSIHKLEIDLDKTRTSGPTVYFTVDFLIRDKSGKIDDRFNGWVQVLVIADVH